MDLTKRVQLSHRITLLSYAALLAALLTGWIAKGPALDNLGLLLIQIIPLLIFLPGLLRRNSMACLWMSCVLLLYIIKAVLNLSLGFDILFASLESISSITLFIATMLFVRYNRIKRLEQAEQN